MRIAWYTHRYFPCVGGSEKFGRSIVRRFVAEGHDVEVLTSDAHDLCYFTDRRRRRVDDPSESWVDRARGSPGSIAERMRVTSDIGKRHREIRPRCACNPCWNLAPEIPINPLLRPRGSEPTPRIDPSQSLGWLTAQLISHSGTHSGTQEAPPIGVRPGGKSNRAQEGVAWPVIRVRMMTV
jgi:hypothetical protein